MQYLFGDSDIAVQRLKVLAQVFSDTTRAFFLEAAVHKPRLALDLGCGPGYSTHLLVEVLQCDRAAGLDNSEHFISLARQSKTEQVSFYLHDITSVPFPVRPADLLYCRFLLTHLKEPQDIVAKWATQLNLEGLLLMEEVEWIDTKKTVFTTYLEILQAMLEHQSNNLYVGPVLNGLAETDNLKRQINRVKPLQVSTQQAATMFFLNMQAWKHQPFIQAHYSASTINQLEENLITLTKQRDGGMEIEWGMRQLAFERV
jgi:ubiquinone/menaquinone biosynthesis C-methylase UbiE